MNMKIFPPTFALLFLLTLSAPAWSQDTLAESWAKAKDAAAEALSKTADEAGQALNKASEATSEALGKAAETTAEVWDKTKDATLNVVEKGARATLDTVEKARGQSTAPAARGKNTARATTAQFDGYPCQTADCSGHRAGYSWARQKRLKDPDDCDNKAEAFIEGCRAYAAGGPGRITREETREPK
jgi:ABC-type transporter Mla subunit MlaD